MLFTAGTRIGDINNGTISLRRRTTNRSTFVSPTGWWLVCTLTSALLIVSLVIGPAVPATAAASLEIVVAGDDGASRVANDGDDDGGDDDGGDNDPKVEDPNDEDPKVEDPNDEDPKVEDPNDEDPKVEDPNDEDPKVEDPNDDRLIDDVKLAVGSDPDDCSSTTDNVRCVSDIGGPESAPAPQADGLPPPPAPATSEPAAPVTASTTFERVDTAGGVALGGGGDPGISTSLSLILGLALGALAGLLFLLLALAKGKKKPEEAAVEA